MNNKKFLLAIVFQVIVILSLIIFRLTVLSGGARIYLRIQPVDPRDLLRGDYATFSYDITTPPSYLFGNTSYHVGESVYVSLREVGTIWEVKSVSRVKPRMGLFIKGVVSQMKTPQSSTKRVNGLLRPVVSQNLITIKYGIEEFFIPQGTGRQFSFRGKDVEALVLIDDDGNAVLKQLYIDGSSWP